MVPFFVFEKEVLLIVNVHRDFKTNVVVFRSFPFHCRNSHIKLIIQELNLVPATIVAGHVPTANKPIFI